MSGENKPSLVVVCVAVTGTPHPGDYFRMVEDKFREFNPNDYAKLGSGIYLANQDACYPAILNIIDYCNQAKNIPGEVNLRLLIAELAESAVVLLPGCPNVQALLARTGRSVRLTKFPPPAPQPQNKPV